MEENKTIEEIFNDYAVDHNYSRWQLLTEDNELFTWEIEQHRYEAVERYAKHREQLAVEKALELASDEAYNAFSHTENPHSLENKILSLKDRVIEELRK